MEARATDKALKGILEEDRGMSSSNGKAPSWQTERLGSLAQVKGGKRLPKGEKLLTEPTPFPYIRVCDFNAFSVDLSDIQYLTPEIQEKISRYIITKEDVFISIAGTIGRVGTIPESLDGANLTENAARVVLERDGSLDKEFLKYCLASPEIQQDIASRRSKNAQPKLALAQIKDLEISLPPLPEQKKIAHILSTVQRAIEAQERVIQTTTELKKALMHKLFTEGLRNEPQKQTEIGPVPESWEVVELGSLAKVGNGSTPKRANEAYWEGGIIPWLNSTKIHDRFITEADQFVTPQAVKECHLPKVAPNSLLIAITGQGKTLGNSAITRIETCINQHLAYAQFHTAKIVPDFVLWFMQTRYDYLRSIAHGGGSTKGALTCGFLKTLPIPVPATDEQKEIVTVFKTLEDKQGSATSKQAVLQGLFRTLLHELMTAKTRVNHLNIAGGKTGSIKP